MACWIRLAPVLCWPPAQMFDYRDPVNLYKRRALRTSPAGCTTVREEHASSADRSRPMLTRLALPR